MTEAKNMEESPLIIGGMHRSGTSLTAALLQSAGVNIGTQMVPAGVGNVKGYFENLDFFDFHRRALESCGLDADGWNLGECKPAADFEVEAKLLVEKSKSRVWGWKDPRTTLFLEFWLKIVPDAKFLFVYREPWQVIDSLYRKRNDPEVLKKPKKALESWLFYNKLIIEFAKAHPEKSMLFHISAFIREPLKCIETITSRFGYPLDRFSRDIFEPTLFKKGVRDEFYAGILQRDFPQVSTVLHELNSLSEAGSTEIFTAASDDVYDTVFQQWSEMRSLEKDMQQLRQAHIMLISELDDQKILLESLKGKIDWMEGSKFWKIRKKWIGLKGKFTGKVE